MINTVASISQEIFTELDSPDNISESAIATWIRTNIGRMNNLLDLELDIDELSQEITPDLVDDEKAILKELYFIKYYERMIQSNLALAASKTITAISDEGSSVKFLSGNDIAKSYRTIKKDSEESLKELVLAYKINRAVPLQVVGTDYIEGF